MLKINELNRLYLGIQGENETRTLTVDVSAWIALYPNGSVTVWHKRNGESEPTATGAEYHSDDCTVTWSPTSTDTYVSGEGEAEFRLIENDVIKKTRKVITGVSPAVTLAGTTLGSDWASYINAVDSLRAGAVVAQEAAEDAQEAAEDAQEAAEDAQEAAEGAQAAAETAQGKAEDAQEAAEAAAARAEHASKVMVPAGGTEGQRLAKKSGTDFDMEWKTDPYYTKPAGGIPASDMAEGAIPDPTSIIDDTAGDGDTNKVWSADKSADLMSALNTLQPSASASDVGKFLKAKTVSGGKVTEYEFGEGGSVDPQDIADAVSDWCDENITEDPTVVIDSSLSVSGAAADASATGAVKTKADNLEAFCKKTIVSTTKGSYNVTAGTAIGSATHLVDVSISNGKAYTFRLQGNSRITKYHLYANNSAIKYNCAPDTDYDLTAGTDITYLSIYTDGTNVTGTGSITGIVTMQATTSNSLEEQIETVRDDTSPFKNAFDATIKFYSDMYEVGASVNNDGNSTYIYHNIIFPITQSEAIGVQCEKLENFTAEHPISVMQLDSSNNELQRDEFTEAQILNNIIKIVPLATATKIKVALYPSTTGGLTTTTAKYYNLIVFTSHDGQLLIKDKYIPSKYEIPVYYQKGSYIQNKIDTIEGFMSDAEGDYDAFIFCTDQHWALNAKQSPRLIRYITERLNIPRMFMGGDYDNGINLDALKAFRESFNGKMYSVIGNHEYMNYLTPIGGVMASHSVDDANLWAYINMGMTDASSGDFSRNYYYVDNPMQKMRYIILSVYADNGNAAKEQFEEDQQEWLANEALDMPSGYTAVVFLHFMYTINYDTGAMTLSTNGNTVQGILDAYDGDGEIACIFAGHAHVDGMATTTGGIPVFVTTCDKYYPWMEGSTDMEPWLTSNRTKGTITEQAFDVVIVDKRNKEVNCVRIGAPADNGTSEKLEVRTQSYA